MYDNKCKTVVSLTSLTEIEPVNSCSFQADFLIATFIKRSAAVILKIRLNVTPGWSWCFLSVLCIVSRFSSESLFFSWRNDSFTDHRMSRIIPASFLRRQPCINVFFFWCSLSLQNISVNSVNFSPLSDISTCELALADKEPSRSMPAVCLWAEALLCVVTQSPHSETWSALVNFSWKQGLRQEIDSSALCPSAPP